MPTFVTRLDLASGQTLQIGERWFKDDKYPVGLVVERPEVSLGSEAEEDPDRPNEPASTTVEKILAHYEVWLLPAELCGMFFTYYGDVHAYLTSSSSKRPDIAPVLQELSKVKNVVCRRVPSSSVTFSEEVVSIVEARTIIHDYFAEKLEIPDEVDKPHVQPQQLGAPNGPGAG